MADAPKATRKAFGEALARLGGAVPGLTVLDADLGKSTMTAEFMKAFPDRYFEIGIAEQNMIGIAAGMALCGKVPVVTSFSCFLIGRLETIRVAVAYNKTNVKLAGTHAGIGIGDDGTSQMGLEDIAAVRALPNMTILQPADERETAQAVEWMLRHDGPVFIRLTRQKVPSVHGPRYRFEPGKSDVVFGTDEGPVDASIFASGGTVGPALAAAQALSGEGTKVRVHNAGTLLPFDSAAAASAAQASGRLVTVEDHNVNGGLGSAVCESVAESGIACPVIRLGVRSFGESASGDELYEKYGISARHIAQACRKPL